VGGTHLPTPVSFLQHIVKGFLILKSKTILVVDDMSLNLRTAKVMLEEFFIVQLAKSGEIALSILAQTEVDVILLDIEMPNMNGFDFMEILHRMPNAKDIPVIVVTSHVSSGLVSHALQLGAKDYLAKPYEKETLLKKIYTIIYKTDKFYMTQTGKCILLFDETNQK
jgi:CheY-like chemotaxis protein